jgi:hypothetical protein
MRPEFPSLPPRRPVPARGHFLLWQCRQIVPSDFPVRDVMPHAFVGGHCVLSVNFLYASKFQQGW